jgi:hypothetical protein
MPWAAMPGPLVATAAISRATFLPSGRRTHIGDPVA